MRRKGVIAILDALLAYTLMFVFAATIILLLTNQDYESGRKSLVLNYWAEDIAESLARSWVAYGISANGSKIVYDDLGDVISPNPENIDGEDYWHNSTYGYLDYRCDTAPYIYDRFFNQTKNLALANGFYVNITVISNTTGLSLNRVYGADGINGFRATQERATAFRYLLGDREDDPPPPGQFPGVLTKEVCNLTVTVGVSPLQS